MKIKLAFVFFFFISFLLFSEELNFFIKNGVVYASDKYGEFRIPSENVKIQNAKKSNFQIKKYGLVKYGDTTQSVFFDENGKLIEKLSIGDLEESKGISLSDNQKYLASDSGTSLIRNLSIYTYPEGKYISSIRYKSNFTWKDDHLYFTAKSEEEIPNFIVEDNQYSYIARINLKNGIIEKIINYNSSNQFIIKNIDSTFIEFTNYYLDDSKNWLNKSRKEIKLKCLNTGDTALLNDTNVRFRKEAGLTSEKIYNFQKNQKVKIIGTTWQKENIEGMENYWYCVQDEFDNIGYVFGAYLDIISTN